MPDDQHEFIELVALALGELDNQRQHAIQSKLQQSPELRLQFERLVEILDTLRHDTFVETPEDVAQRAIAIMRMRDRETASSWTDSLQNFVAELVFDTRVRPALAGFRSLSASAHVVYRSQIASVDLQMSAGARPQEPWTLRGQIKSSAEDYPLRVTLRSPKERHAISEAVPDERGRFTFQADVGNYDLVLGMSSGDVVIQDLRVG